MYILFLPRVGLYVSFLPLADARGKTSWHKGLPVLKTIYTYGFHELFLNFTSRKTIKPFFWERRNKTKHIEAKRIITKLNLLKTKHYKFNEANQSCKNYYINLCTLCKAYESEVHSVHRSGARRAKKRPVKFLMGPLALIICVLFRFLICFGIFNYFSLFRKIIM